ncbi:hypothetical protein NQ315_001993 [Exocentrus adspersus]|uniref:Uncharacterized protein n=1 Tax=Exocentrus adspersus TaxID=1586481 RepID=A0AAV8WA92_9CUCU|nr:hypothetical protein NQ315_001993 [Exocentrus adspersus]
MNLHYESVKSHSEEKSDMSRKVKRCKQTTCSNNRETTDLLSIKHKYQVQLISGHPVWTWQGCRRSAKKYDAVTYSNQLPRAPAYENYAVSVDSRTQIL